MPRKLRVVDKQKGFTLIEMIAVIAIGGLILSAAAVTISQLFIINAQNTARMKAVKQVESAIHWVSRDVQTAQTVKTDVPETLLTLTWVEWNNPENEVQVTYTLNNGDLRRNHSVSGQTIVAHHIESALVAPKPYTGSKLNFTITATLGGLRSASETRVVEIIPRPSL
jgi:prepilin-type N-terminal cleavage/methylation domain-containing protein